MLQSCCGKGLVYLKHFGYFDNLTPLIKNSEKSILYVLLVMSFIILCYTRNSNCSLYWLSFICLDIRNFENLHTNNGKWWKEKKNHFESLSSIAEILQFTSCCSFSGFLCKAVRFPCYRKRSFLLSTCVSVKYISVLISSFRCLEQLSKFLQRGCFFRLVFLSFQRNICAAAKYIFINSQTCELSMKWMARIGSAWLQQRNWPGKMY